MSLMKYAIAILLLAIEVSSNVEEAKSSQNNASLTSLNDNKHQNKRLAIYGGPSTSALISGFTPISTSYPSVNNYVGNQQLYTSATGSMPASSNVYAKSIYNPYFAQSSNNIRFPSSSLSYSKSPIYSQYPLTYTASQPAQNIAYNQSPSSYTYPTITQHSSPQFYAQQMPFNYYGSHQAQPISPIVHAIPVASFAANSYQTPANAYYANPQIHKIPIQSTAHNQQPQIFNMASYQPSNYQVKESIPSSAPAPATYIASKPVALHSTQSPTSSSIDHKYGAMSYSHFSQMPSSVLKPSAAPLIGMQSPQAYYQQTLPIYNSDYSKYSQHPFASNYFPSSQNSVHYGTHLQPYGHISKIPMALPTATSPLLPSLVRQEKLPYQ